MLLLLLLPLQSSAVACNNFSRQAHKSRSCKLEEAVVAVLQKCLGFSAFKTLPTGKSGVLMAFC